MDTLWETLLEPSSFEEMTLLIRNRNLISTVQQYLSTKRSLRKPQILLSAWLISRFPETVENSPNEALLMAANVVKTTCLNGNLSSEILEVYANTLEAWKSTDKPELEQQLVTAYLSLQDRSLQTQSSQEILEETRIELLSIARQVGGEELVSQMLASSRK
jgi:hypothetical protein